MNKRALLSILFLALASLACVLSSNLTEPGEEIPMVKPLGWLPERDTVYAEHVNDPNSHANLQNSQAHLNEALAFRAEAEAIKAEPNYQYNSGFAMGLGCSVPIGILLFFGLLAVLGGRIVSKKKADAENERAYTVQRY